MMAKCFPFNDSIILHLRLALGSALCLKSIALIYVRAQDPCSMQWKTKKKRIETNMKMSTLLQRNRIGATCNNKQQQTVTTNRRRKKNHINLKIELHTPNSKPKNCFSPQFVTAMVKVVTLRLFDYFIISCFFLSLFVEKKCYVISN